MNEVTRHSWTTPLDVRRVPPAENANTRGTEPLNATLAGSLMGGEPAYVGVALAAAEYNAAAGTVAYQVVLAEEEGPAQVAATTLVGPAEQQVFGPGHLFIDSGCAKGCGVTFIGCCCESDPLDCA